MNWKRKVGYFVFLIAMTFVFWPISCGMVGEKIGVIFVIHGGQDTNQPEYMWNAAVQMQSYDPNHPVYKIVLWNAENWGMVLDSEFALKFLRKYDFEYERIGGTDPYTSIEEQLLTDMKTELDTNSYGITFEVDWAGWMCGDRVKHYPYPRYIYHDPSGEGDDVTYCGEDEDDGPWSGCDPNRYDVDGPVERLLKKGVSQIIMIDTTVGGVRFSKTYEVVQMTKRALEKWNEKNGRSIPLTWINDYTNLMERSYPTEPKGWTRSLGLPEIDQEVPLDGSPNPIAEDSDLATLQVEAIESAMSDTVPDVDTGVIILNHALHNNNEVFDPKIDDTLIINKNIKSQLMTNHPDMDPDNIIGAYMGIKEENPENGLVERTRKMRGEDLGHAWLYESDKELPGDEWGYLYWDALEYLKDRGVKHIVIGFPQIVTDSVLNLVEFPNQIAKEIGFKTWAKWGTWDYDNYPEAGHPFTDYWGNWVDTACGDEPCCFTMGGCGSEGDYPPSRQTDMTKARGDMDPSLAYDVSEYGHLGYDPALGTPNPNGPVQDQYKGTWAIYYPPNGNSGICQLLVKHVLNAALGEYNN
ncbi:MAG: hypothetical protein KAJ00_01160 [Deltaproteobacteria bacterium]|nr:hypothetical protein [Deltaproteobacteria bacterium]